MLAISSSCALLSVLFAFPDRISIGTKFEIKLLFAGKYKEIKTVGGSSHGYHPKRAKKMKKKLEDGFNHDRKVGRTYYANPINSVFFHYLLTLHNGPQHQYRHT